MPVSWLAHKLGTSQTQTQYVTVIQTHSFKEYIQVVRTRGKKFRAHLMTHRILTHVRLKTQTQLHNMYYEDNKHNSEAQCYGQIFLHNLYQPEKFYRVMVTLCTVWFNIQ